MSQIVPSSNNTSVIETLEEIELKKQTIENEVESLRNELQKNMRSFKLLKLTKML